MAEQSSGSIWGTVATIAGIAAAVAIPFLAPAIAGSIFGASVMAAWGGFGGVLAAAGTGAVLGGLVGAGVNVANGRDWQSGAATGALFGGLGGGAVQGVGGFASGAAPLFGAPTSGGITAFAPAAATAAPSVAGTAFGGGVAGVGTTALGASGAAPAGLSALGQGFQMPWDKLWNAGTMAIPQLLGAATAEVMPPSDEAQGLQDAMEESYQQQQAQYELAMKGGMDIDPHYFAQTAANAARLRTAGMIKEGNRAAYGGVNDPARAAAENRRASVAASSASGQAYNDSYLTALQAKQGAVSAAAGLRPDINSYASGLTEYGVDAEKKKRSEDWTAWLAPFAGAFAKTNTSQQAGTA